MSVIIAPLKSLDKEMGTPSGFRHIAVFYLLANTGTTIDR